LDAGRWKGQTVAFTFDPAEPALAAAIKGSDDLWSPETIYQEPLRPRFHFSSRRGWLNDPNGLVYHGGRYHLFYQHNPYGWGWGNMHWGHAVSADLIHWEERPIALYPIGDNDLIFSGSAISDLENTSGWGSPGQPALVAAFTSTGRGECIAYSNDEGETWTEYEGNPVVKHPDEGRDPRLLWHAPSRQWVMVVYDQKRQGKPMDQHIAGATERDVHGLSFHTSPDLKTWRERSWISGFYECPDLFALPVNDDPRRTKWILTAASGGYAIGEFDGERFLPEGEMLGPPGGVPKLFYAPQTYSNHPDWLCVQMAWGLVKTPDSPFNQMMLTPTVLSLRTTADGIRLCREPVASLESLRTETFKFPAGPLRGTPLLTELAGDAWDIEAVFRVGSIAFIIWDLGGDKFIYDAAERRLNGPGGSVGIPLVAERLRLRLLVDRTSIEVFGDCGQAYGVFARTAPGAPAPLALSLGEAKSRDSGVEIESLVVHALRSAW